MANGKRLELPGEINVTRLLVEAGAEMPEYVSVQVNDRMLVRENFDATIIHDGDVVEFLYYMGGGQGVVVC
ncbi:MAG: sulfur carrier protein ThiS [Spirochaetales bacterium]|nr:sulfur carrier protein ThiS [Spirochaetales bacterium]